MSLRQKIEALESEIKPHPKGIIETVKDKAIKKQVEENEENLLLTLKRILEENKENFFEGVLIIAEFVEQEQSTLKVIFGLEPTGENKLALALELIKKFYDHINEDDTKKLIKVYCSLSKNKTVLNKEFREKNSTQLTRERTTIKKVGKSTRSSKKSGCFLL